MIFWGEWQCAIVFLKCYVYEHSLVSASSIKLLGLKLGSGTDPGPLHPYWIRISDGCMPINLDFNKPCRGA